MITGEFYCKCTEGLAEGEFHNLHCDGTGKPADWVKNLYNDFSPIRDLLHQIQISDYKDENGHRLVDNEAYLRLKGSL